MDKVLQYFKNVLVAFDRLINTVFGGDSLETISSRCYRNRERWICRAVLWVCDLFQKNHGQKVLEPEDHHQNEIF